MNLPTKITFSRIIAIVVMIITLVVLSLIPNFESPEMIPTTKINWVYGILFIFFAIASYTDALDGKIARKRNLVTDFGKFLDPVADKLLVNSMVIFLIAPQISAPYAAGNVSFNIWCAIVMIVRDTVVDALRFIAAKKNIVIAANKWGKLKTVLQMVAISMILLNDFPFHYLYGSPNEWYSITNLTVYAATLVSFISGVIYVVQNRQVFKEGDK